MDHRHKGSKDQGGLSVAMFVEKPVPDMGRLGPGRFLPDRIRCTSLGIFRTDRIALAGVCDRSLS